MPEIHVNISPAGKVTLDAQGFQGTTCTEVTEHLEQMLGGGSAKRTEKPEYHMPSASVEHNKLIF